MDAGFPTLFSSPVTGDEKMLNQIVREMTPPFIVRAARFLLKRDASITESVTVPAAIPYSMFRGDYASFEAAERDAIGYDSDNAGKSAASRLKEMLESGQPVEIDSRFQQVHSALSIIREWSKKDHLSVLDFGGGNGGYYFRIREFFPKSFFSWSVIETDSIVNRCGPLASDGLEFLNAIPQDKRFDVSIVCGSLQYVQQPYDVLKSIAEQSDWIILTRVPAHVAQDDKYMVQTVPSHIHEGSMPVTIFSEKKLRNAILAIGDIKQIWSVSADEGSLIPIGAEPVGYLIKTKS